VQGASTGILVREACQMNIRTSALKTRCWKQGLVCQRQNVRLKKRDPDFERYQYVMEVQNSKRCGRHSLHRRQTAPARDRRPPSKDIRLIAIMQSWPKGRAAWRSEQEEDSERGAAMATHVFESRTSC
jgi:hypothetical protein